MKEKSPIVSISIHRKGSPEIFSRPGTSWWPAIQEWMDDRIACFAPLNDEQREEQTFQVTVRWENGRSLEFNVFTGTGKPVDLQTQLIKLAAWAGKIANEFPEEAAAVLGTHWVHQYSTLIEECQIG